MVEEQKNGEFKIKIFNDKPYISEEARKAKEAKEAAL